MRSERRLLIYSMSDVSDEDSPFVSVLTQRDCPHLTHLVVSFDTKKEYGLC